MSTLQPIDGNISAKPFTSTLAGRVSGAVCPPRSGSVTGDVGGSPVSSAVAELGNLISSLGSLSAQAQSMPLSAPTLPGLQEQSYRPQATDYTQFNDDSN
ncbi:MAG: hypothetical protein WBE79_09285 [Candidatus Cybelea sp.]